MEHGDVKQLKINNETNVKSWKPFLRQILVCTGVWTAFFMYGLIVGSPTVFIPQLRKELNSTEAISYEMASWLPSVIGFSGFPCVLILALLTRLLGRKISFMIACVDTFVAYIVFYNSTSVMQILASLIMQGLFSAAQIVVSVLILTEYISPKYRGLVLTIKSATFYWGIWAANALGTFFHWKNIGLVGITCSLYTMATILIWPESPYWLASKGRYKECAASHRWLKGCDEDSEKELETLIATQKEYVKSCRNANTSILGGIKEFFNVITAVEFYKPTMLSFMTGLLSVMSGKLVCTVYALDILKKITKSDSTAYTGMLILDGVTVFSMYAGCTLSKFIKRRTLLLVSSTIGVGFLLIMSLYLYLIHLSIITENKYVSLFLLSLFSIAVSCGPLIMSGSVYGELIPIRSRNLAVCVIALCGKLALGMSLKLAPYIFRAFDIHGAFLYHGIGSALCIVLLYKYLPETKDKTLQEIADSIQGVKNDKKAEVSNLMKTRKKNTKTSQS